MVLLCKGLVIVLHYFYHIWILVLVQRISVIFCLVLFSHVLFREQRRQSLLLLVHLASCFCYLHLEFLFAEHKRVPLVALVLSDDFAVQHVLTHVSYYFVSVDCLRPTNNVIAPFDKIHWVLAAGVILIFSSLLIVLGRVALVGRVASWVVDFVRVLFGKLVERLYESIALTWELAYAWLLVLIKTKQILIVILTHAVNVASNSFGFSLFKFTVIAFAGLLYINNLFGNLLCIVSLLNYFFE